jgi:hypothetical protein
MERARGAHVLSLEFYLFFDHVQESAEAVASRSSEIQ